MVWVNLSFFYKLLYTLPQLSRPKQLVYSGHIYPFSPIISDLDYPLFKGVMHSMQVAR